MKSCDICEELKCLWCVLIIVMQLKCCLSIAIVIIVTYTSNNLCFTLGAFEVRWCTQGFLIISVLSTVEYVSTLA